MSELQQPRFDCAACGLDKGPGRTLRRLCLACHHKETEANRNAAIEMDLANAKATIARLEAELAEAVKQRCIVELSVQLEEDLSNRADAFLRTAWTEQWKTTECARLVIDMQKRIAADWCEVGRARVTISKLEAENAAHSKLIDTLCEQARLAVEKEMLLNAENSALREGLATSENLCRKVGTDFAAMKAENAGLRKRAEDSRLVVLYNGPASGCATVSGDWARRTFGPDRCAQITIEAIGNRLTVKPYTANGGGGGQ